MHRNPLGLELCYFYDGSIWHKGMIGLSQAGLLVECCAVTGCCMTGLAIARMQDIDGKDTQLNKYQGKVVLVVNLASRWQS